jgi:hypothetical protein
MNLSDLAKVLVSAIDTVIFKAYNDVYQKEPSGNHLDAMTQSLDLVASPRR